MSIAQETPVELEVGRIRRLTDNRPAGHRDGHAAPPRPPAGPPDEGGGRGDGDRPSRLERIALGLLHAANYLLLAAVVVMLIEERRRNRR